MANACENGDRWDRWYCNGTAQWVIRVSCNKHRKVSISDHDPESLVQWRPHYTKKITHTTNGDHWPLLTQVSDGDRVRHFFRNQAYPSFIIAYTEQIGPLLSYIFILSLLWHCSIIDLESVKVFKGVHPRPILWLFVDFSKKLQHIGDKQDMFPIGSL